jgi:hypothetical protein
MRENPTRLEPTREMIFILYSKWRPESVGAESQLESMAAENTVMVPLKPEDAQVLKGPFLHRSNPVSPRVLFSSIAHGTQP